MGWKRPMISYSVRQSDTYQRTGHKKHAGHTRTNRHVSYPKSRGNPRAARTSTAGLVRGSPRQLARQWVSVPETQRTSEYYSLRRIQLTNTGWKRTKDGTTCKNSRTRKRRTSQKKKKRRCRYCTQVRAAPVSSHQRTAGPKASKSRADDDEDDEKS